MNVTILGTGQMARAIAARLLAGGHSIQLLGRSADDVQQLADELRSMATSSEAVAVGPLEEPLIGEVIFFAVPYAAAPELVRRYSEELNGKIVVDISNPVSDSYDSLLTEPGTSAAEEISKKLPPGARIVKAFNTVFAGTLAEGQVSGEVLDVFIAGDDQPSRRRIAELAEDGGLRAIDVGPLSGARALEEFQLLHMSVQQQLRTRFASAIKIIS